MKPNYDIFISFADEDREYALQLSEALIAQDLKVWCSAKDVKIGGNIHEEVSHALAHSKFFLPIISKHYQREWHRKEFHNAGHDKLSAHIIPLAYGVDYQYIKAQAMFSLILEKKPLEVQKYTLSRVVAEIKAIITQTPPQDYGVPQSLDDFSVKLRCSNSIKFLYFFKIVVFYQYKYLLV